MRNLFGFILRHRFFFLFLLLQAVAIGLTVSHQYYQQTFFLNSANALTGRAYASIRTVADYLALRTTNQLLLEENTRLLERLKENYIITDGRIYVSGDTTYQQRYTYTNANVINNSTIRRNNHITLNKGTRHGVAPDMGVITSDGVAGIIVSTSKNFSVAMSLLHSDIMISVKIVKNDHIGTLRWEGKDHQRAHMAYIPSHVELEVGDTVATSGFSTVFPENVLIGTIRDWEIRRGETFYTATVDLAMDFNAITYVYIVKHLMKEEQETLESSVLPGM